MTVPVTVMLWAWASTAVTRPPWRVSTTVSPVRRDSREAAWPSRVTVGGTAASAVTEAVSPPSVRTRKVITSP